LDINAYIIDQLTSVVADSIPGGLIALMHGKVIDLKIKKGIPHSVVNIWPASSTDKYDFQDPNDQATNNLHGRIRTDANDDCRSYCLRSTAYSLP